jgi:hypothetical protein
VICPVQLKNTGKLTLPSVNLTATAPATTACSPTASPTLAPGDEVNCTLTAPAGQDAYDAGTLALQVEATADPLGPTSATLGGTLTHGPSVTLNNSASMDVTVLGAGTITKAGRLKQPPVAQALLRCGHFSICIGGCQLQCGLC